MIRAALVLALLAAYTAAAARTVASVRSTRTFRIGRATVPAEGSRSWPVVEGDQIVSGQAPAIFEFPDGSRVTLDAGSRLKLEAGNGHTTVRLLEGSLTYRLEGAPAVEVYNRETRATGSSGTLYTPGRRPPPHPPGRPGPGPRPPPISPWK